MIQFHHTNNTKEDYQMDASMITRYTNAPTPRQRLNDYYEKLDAWLQAVDQTVTQAEPVKQQAPVTWANNISKFLRKGGAK